MSQFAGRAVGTQTSSGVTFVEVVQPAELGNSHNLARRGGVGGKAGDDPFQGMTLI
jgi:hypothetical protein